MSALWGDGGGQGHTQHKQRKTAVGLWFN